MSKLIIKATDFAAITPDQLPAFGYYVIGIDVIDGGFKKLDHLGILTSIGGSSLPFDGNRPVTRPGLPVVTVGHVDNVNQFVDQMFFPAQGPLLSMSTTNAREFGDSKSFDISYTATRRTNPVTSLVVDNNIIGPDGTVSQSGVVNHVLTDYIDTTFTGVISDGNNPSSASTSITWYNKRFAFVNSLNLVDGSQSPSQISAILNGLSSGSYSYSNNKSGTNTLNPSNQYMYYGYILLGNPNPTNFIVNTIANNAYTYVDFVYTNQFGLAKTFRLWKSGNLTTGAFTATIS